MSKSKQILFIVGPTAIGKSQVAMSLAQKLNGEIVSCDSMQIYKQIDIASNKPTQEDLNSVVHHLINTINVDEDFDVVRFRSIAIEAISDVLARGKLPICVGGSGLYVQVLLDGIFEGPKRNDEIRGHLLQEASIKGNNELHDRLKKLDKAAADKLHPNDLKRVVRALEVLMTEKQPISNLQKQRVGLFDTHDVTVIGLNRDRDALYEQINNRVDQMIDEGLVDEIKSLKKVNMANTASALIGVKEILGFLNKQYDLDRAAYLMKRNTRHFAKRQLTWFRKDKRICWVECGHFQDADQIADEITTCLKGKT